MLTTAREMKAFLFHLKLICVFASIYGNISSRSTCEETGRKKSGLNLFKG